MHERAQTPQRQLFEGIDQVVVPDDISKTYQTAFGNFVGNTRLAELTTVDDTGTVMWSESITSHAWDLSARLANYHELVDTEAGNRRYSNEHVDLVSEAIQFHGFDTAMATGVSAIIGNRAMRGLKLTNHEKETLRSLPISSWSALSDIIEHTLASYMQGFEEAREGRLAGVVTKQYLDNLAAAYAAVGNNFKRPEKSALPSSIDTIPKLKVNLLIEGHADFLASGKERADDPYIALGRTFVARNPRVDPKNQEAEFVPVDISALVDMRSRNFEQQLAQAGDIYANLLQGAKAKQEDIKRAGGTKRSAIVTAAAVSTSLLFAQQAAAAPSKPSAALPHITDTSISVTAVTVPTYEVAATPTDISRFAGVMPISVIPAEANVKANAIIQQSGVVEAKPVKVEQVNTEDPLALATLAAAEGMSGDSLSAVIQDSVPAEAKDTGPVQSAEAPKGVGNDKLSKAMLANADSLDKWLKGSRGENLKVDVKGQVDIYTQYIKAAADDPSVLNPLLIHKEDFLAGTVLAGQADVVRALVPSGMAFFENEDYAGKTLTDEQIQLLAGLWANARASMLTDQERETIIAQANENYDERPNDVTHGTENEQDKPKPDAGNVDVGEIKDTLEKANPNLNQKKLKLLQEVTVSAMKAKAKGSKINVEVLVAQAIHESGWGQSDLAEKANNLFGVKAGDSWKGKRISMKTGEVFNGNSVTVDASWRAYDSIEDAIADYIKMVTNQDNFADAIKCSDDAGSYIDGLLAKLDPETCKITIPQGEQGAMSYATDPDYKNKILRTITSLGLDKFANSKPFVVKKSPESAPDKSDHKESLKTVKGMGEKAKAELDAFLNSVTRNGSQLTSGYTNKGIEDTKSRGLKNGRFPDSELVQVTKHGHRLQKAAAESYFAMDEAFNTDHPGKHLNFGTILTAYRTYAEQEDLKKRKGKWAADPGTSNHGMGRAGDFSDMGAGSLRDEWMKANAWKFGWFKPEGLGPNSAKGTYEPWHYEFVLINWED